MYTAKNDDDFNKLNTFRSLIYKTALKRMMNIN